MCADTKERETFGSLWSSCAGDQPTEKERKYFETWMTGAETLSVNVRVHVQDQATGGKSVYNGPDALVAKVRMADSLREHFAEMLMDPIGSQQVRRSTGGEGQGGGDEGGKGEGRTVVWGAGRAEEGEGWRGEER